MSTIAIAEVALARKSRRGGARAGAGRKPFLDGAEPYKVNLDPVTVTQLRDLGGGNLSAGVRAAALRTPSERLDAGLPTANLGQEQLAALTRLEPGLVDASRFSGRHKSAFTDSAFTRLKDAVQHAGGNLVPVLVRRVASGRYELAYGRRRLQACSELGLPLQAVVTCLRDHDLALAMLSEAVFDDSWSAYELGDTFSRILEAGLYVSARRLAEAAHLPRGEVDACLTLKRLPKDAVAAFASPRAIRLAWATKLGIAATKDLDGLVSRARAMVGNTARLSAAKVFAALTKF